MECGQQPWKMKCCALRKFPVIDGPSHIIRCRVIEHPHVSDQIALCEFHSFLVEVQNNYNAGYIHA